MVSPKNRTYYAVYFSKKKISMNFAYGGVSMINKGRLLRVKRVVKNVLLSAFLLAWSIGMMCGGIYGMAAVAFGIPAVIGFTVFQ